METLYRCAKCHLLLPASEFYQSQGSEHRDSYCKSCRKAASRKQYNNQLRQMSGKRRARYTPLTDIADPTERMRLLKKALAVVAASIERKRQRVQEETWQSLYVVAS